MKRVIAVATLIATALASSSAFADAVQGSPTLGGSSGAAVESSSGAATSILSFELPTARGAVQPSLALSLQLGCRDAE